MDGFMKEFYGELQEKYQDIGDPPEEETFFFKKLEKKEAPKQGRRTPKSLINMIDNFFGSLVNAEVEEQSLSFEEFSHLKFRRGLPSIIWDFFETLWLYSADDEEEFEHAQRVGEDIDRIRFEKLEKAKAKFDDQTISFAWKIFKRLSRNPRLDSQLNCYLNHFTMKRNFHKIFGYESLFWAN